MGGIVSPQSENTRAGAPYRAQCKAPGSALMDGFLWDARLLWGSPQQGRHHLGKECEGWPERGRYMLRPLVQMSTSDTTQTRCPWQLFSLLSKKSPSIFVEWDQKSLRVAFFQCGHLSSFHCVSFNIMSNTFKHFR